MSGRRRLGRLANSPARRHKRRRRRAGLPRPACHARRFRDTIESIGGVSAYV